MGAAALHSASLRGKLDIIKCLIAAKADVNKINKRGQTPLHYAAQVLYDNPEPASLLLVAKADKNVMDEDGKTASDIAYDDRNYKIARLLAVK